jgi:hypothetical protein
MMRAMHVEKGREGRRETASESDIERVTRIKELNTPLRIEKPHLHRMLRPAVAASG